MTEERTQSWLKHELDELDEAQKMIFDTITSFEPQNGREQPPSPPPVTASANMDSNTEVSNSQPISEADRSVAELLSSLNIETDSSLLKKSDPDLPPPPSLDDLIIDQPSVVLETSKMNTSKPAPPAVLPKPNKKPTTISTVKIQLKGKEQSNQPKPQPITIVAPIVLDEPPPKPAVPSKTAEPPLPTPPPQPSAPILAPKPTPPAPAPKPTPPATAPKPAAVPAPASSLPTLTLDGAMTEEQDKALADLENDLEFYTKTLLSNVENPKDEEFYGYCEKCNQVVEGEQVGCKAFDKIYHISCFNCETCKKSVHGVQFYAVNKKTFCEKCYLDSLDNCAVCKNLITDKILRASDKTYHPDCFKCSVCSKSLDGIPFTVDDDNVVYCVDDYYKRFAPKCSACGDSIIPEEGKEETIRIVALDRDFHIYCYKCVKCGQQLSSGKDGKGCYPLNGEIMCLNCNTMATA